MFKQFLAVAVMAVSAQASAFTLNFNDLPNGQSPGEAYAQYGVHITGGTVLNGQVAGAFTMTFDPGFDVLRLDFTYAKLNEGYSIVHSDRWGTDAMFRDPTINPYCGGPVECEAKGMRYISPDQLFPDRFIFEAGMGVTQITLANAWTDNLVFTMAERALPAGDVATGEIPLPGTLALLAAGMLALGARRRRK